MLLSGFLLMFGNEFSGISPVATYGFLHSQHGRPFFSSVSRSMIHLGSGARSLFLPHGRHLPPCSNQTFEELKYFCFVGLMIRLGYRAPALFFRHGRVWSRLRSLPWSRNRSLLHAACCSLSFFSRGGIRG